MIFPLHTGLVKAGMPLIISSKGPNKEIKNLCFLIDTGSTHNILFSYVYEFVKDDIKPLNTQHNLMGFEGKSQQGKMVEVNLSFEEKDYKIPMVIIDANAAMGKIHKDCGIQIHGILGMSFLLEHHWTLDFKNYIVTDETEQKEK